CEISELTRSPYGLTRRLQTCARGFWSVACAQVNAFKEETMTAAPESSNILVIDDDSEVRYSLQRVLTSRGYHGTAAASGEEGLRQLETSEPDLVFLDVRMDGMGGIETLQRLRQSDPRAIVVLMTAYGTTQTAIAAMKFGAFDYILKPFDV